MNYAESIEYIYKQLPMFHRIGKAAYKANLNNALALDNYFKTPHKHYKTIHVAGTNGKGSVSHMLAAILQTAGYKTGLFTSPHLKDFRERIRVNGEMIPENYVAEFITHSQSLFNSIQPSFFEMTSAMAFEYFKDTQVDVAIIEVGLGGRLDSTNIITPQLSVITNIGLDHTEFLGETLEKIAFEKAGIIKENTPAIIGEFTPETLPVFNNVAKEKHSPLILASEKYKVDYSLFTSDRKQSFQVQENNEVAYANLVLDLGGFYQRKNICTVLATIDQLNKTGFNITKAIIYEALLQVTQLTGLRGRWQIIGNNPLTICDTGHNYDGISWVVNQIQSTPYKQLHMVIGFVEDKALDKILPLLPKNATYYFTQAKIPRALDAAKLYEIATAAGLTGKIIGDVAMAVQYAQKTATADDMIFIGGSTFVVGEAL